MPVDILSRSSNSPSWHWDQTNALWQFFHNPQGLLNASYASNFYKNIHQNNQYNIAAWVAGQLTGTLASPSTWGDIIASTGANLLAGGNGAFNNPYSIHLRPPIKNLFNYSWEGQNFGAKLQGVLHPVGSFLSSIDLVVPLIEHNININNFIGKQNTPLGFFNDFGFGGLGVIGGFVGGEVAGSVVVLAGGGTLATLAAPILVSIAVGAAFVGVGHLVKNAASHVGQYIFSPHPQVGGILLDKCATIIGNLPQITGAYWDSSRGALVLHGPANMDESPEMTLAGVEFDHLMVALRAALAGEHIGVSIDPPAGYRDGIHKGVFPPAGTPMYVSYLGNTEGTLFGAIMFEADRVMKCLSKGKDNVTGHSLRPQKVAGYGSLLDLFNHFGSGGSGSWFRFWLVIDIVEIAHDPSAKAIRFGNVCIKVMNETELWNSGEGTRKYSKWFAPYNIIDLRSFAIKLKNQAQTDSITQYLVNNLSVTTQKLLFTYNGGINSQLRNSLVDDLNRVIQNGAIFNTQRFSGFKLSVETQNLLNQNPQGEELIYLNRILLTDAYPKELSKDSQDPACAAFAEHLTEHYEEYAREFPIFTRLKEIAKLSALARFLVNEGVAIDSQTIFKQPLLPVSTPETTPGICVRATSGGGGTQSLFGGVDMNVHPTIISKDDALAQRARESAQAACPDDFVATWNFMGPEGLATACSMRLGAVKKPYRALTSSDHAFQDSWRDTMRSLQRYYDSSVPGGDFGPGWWLFMPYRLEIIPPSRKRPEVRLRSEQTEDDLPSVLTLHNFINPASQIYRRDKKADNDNGFAYFRITHQMLDKDSVSYSVDKSDAIRYLKGDYAYSDGKYTFRFNSKGQLSETMTADGVLARYKWSDNLLDAISFGGGQSYQIHYNRNFLQSSISEIIATDGIVLKYIYDHRGLLHECMKDNSLKVSYRYDQQRRISETRNGEGIVVKRNAYDSNGNKIEEKESITRLSDGTHLQRKFEDGRISIVRDEPGGSAEYFYQKDGSLASIRGLDSGNEKWKLEYDKEGRLIGAKDSQGVYHKISYHPDGQVKRVEGDNGSWVQLPLVDEKKGEINGSDPRGGNWSVKRNDLGLPDTIIDSSQNKHHFRYDKNGLKSMKSLGWSFDVINHKNETEFRAKSDLGINQTLIIDKHGEKAHLSLEGPEKGNRHLYVDKNGYKIQDCAGYVEYRFNEQALTCDVIFEF